MTIIRETVLYRCIIIYFRNFKASVKINDWNIHRMRYFKESSSSTVRSYPSVHLAFIGGECTQCTQSLARIARRKSSAREAHLTGALGHGRFDAGAKMTDKRREWRSLVVCSWKIMHRLSAARA